MLVADIKRAVPTKNSSGRRDESEKGKNRFEIVNLEIGKRVKNGKSLKKNDKYSSEKERKGGGTDSDIPGLAERGSGRGERREKSKLTEFKLLGGSNDEDR